MCVCRVDERARSGSESRAGTGANWSRLVCSIFVPNYPPRFSFHLVLSLFRPSPLIPHLRLSPPDLLSHRAVLVPRARPPRRSIYPALATAQPLYRPLAPPFPLPLHPIQLAPRLRLHRFGTIRDARLNPHHFARYRIIRAHLRPRQGYQPQSSTG